MIRIEDLPAPPSGKRGWPWTEGTSNMGNVGHFSFGIVTPSYNQAAFLEETIRSVLLQGYPNLEYGVMDGGSSDGSVEIIRKYAPFLSFWESRPDKGQSDAINQGFAKSKGSILAYLNSDDVYEPGTLQTVAPLFDRGGVDIVYGGFASINEAGEVQARHSPNPFDAGRLLLDNMIVQPSTFWSSSVRQRLGDFDVGMHFSMDCDYWIRACAAGFRFTSVDRCLSRFRFHSASKTVVQTARFWDDLLLSLRMIEERGSLPEKMQTMLPRAFCRASWRAATACFGRGEISLARSHVESACLKVSHNPHEEELAMAFQLCALSPTGVISPREFRFRKNELGLHRGVSSKVWRTALDREYTERTAKGAVSPGRLVLAALDDPRRLLNWGFRRAFIAAFKRSLMSKGA